MKRHRYATLAGWVGAGFASVFLAACGGGGGGDPRPETAVSAGESTGPGTVQETGQNTAQDPGQDAGQSTPQIMLSANGSGAAATLAETGVIDSANPFFKPFGNGRSCASCHQQNDSWSITPATAQAMFSASGGADPLFVRMDGANSPTADVSTVEARRAAYSMLLNKGLIRVGLGIPADAEFELAAVDDPYGYASSAELSLFRRPLPSTNLRFLVSVMWDNRETYLDPGSGICFTGTTLCYSALDFNLGSQASHAVLGHAQAESDLTPDERAAIVRFERGLFTAQLQDNDAKLLTGTGANGGPLALSKTGFYFGINDIAAGDYRTKAPFTPNAMTLYDAWNTGSGNLADAETPASEAPAVTRARQSIARGQALFNKRQFEMRNVAGLNDDFRIAAVTGTCTTCHNAPNAGSHATPLMFNIGVSDAARRTADMPLYTLRNKTSGETVRTMDPGAAMQSGKWSDIGRFKVPTLRGLAARAPYFHDGSAKDLASVVRFYNGRFNIGLSAQEVQDLTAFLQAL